MFDGNEISKIFVESVIKDNMRAPDEITAFYWKWNFKVLQSAWKKSEIINKQVKQFLDENRGSYTKLAFKLKNGFLPFPSVQIPLET